MKRLVIACVVASACGSRTPPVHQEPQASSRDASFELDYAAPRDRSARRTRHVKLLEQLAQACRQGRSESCWRGATLVRRESMHGELNDPLDAARVFLIGVENACVAGDDTSCHVLAELVEHIENGHALEDDHPDQQCQRGVGLACLAVALTISVNETDGPARRNEWLQRGCALNDGRSCRDLHDQNLADKAARLLRSECDRGWGRSCSILQGDEAHDEAEMAKTNSTVWMPALRSCRAGVLDDCGYVEDRGAPVASRIAALNQLCPSRGEGCSALGQLLLAPGPDDNPDAARDAFEQGCQIGDDFTCLELAHLYVDKTLPEPVTGRGHELAAYLCELPEKSWNLVTWNGMPFAHAVANAHQAACELRDSKP